MPTLTILGSTGSIGQSTLSVIDKNPEIKLFALTANKNIELLSAQCEKYQPDYAVIVDKIGRASCRERV